MSPRKRRLRDRKKIRAPSRYEDTSNDTPSPRQESPEESEGSSGIGEEIYKTPEPRKPKTKKSAYRGKVIEYNPNLPPAAFPTLDHPDYVHNGGNTPFNLDSHLLGLRSRNASRSHSESSTPDPLGRNRPSEDIDVIGKDPAMVSAKAGSTRGANQSLKQTSTHEQRRSRNSTPSSIYGEPTDNGPRNPTWLSNMARMEEAGRMSDLQRNMLDMETSDEEDAATRPAKIAKSDSSLEFPTWDDLTVAHKLDLADAIGELDPDATDVFEVMDQLRLSVSQKEELTELLIERQERAATEEANQQRHLEKTKAVLLQGPNLSQSAFHQMVEENLYGTISHKASLQTQTTPMELRKARAYLRNCGFDAALADQGWDVSSIPNAQSSTISRRAQRKAKGSLPNTAAHAPPSPLGTSRQRPVRTPSQQEPCAVGPSLGSVQHSHPTPAHALIAQHSPAAPLSKVPVQAFRVAPSIQNGDPRSKYQRTARIPQPTLPASSKQPSASKGADLPAINNTLLKIRGGSSHLPISPEEDFLPAGSYFLPSQGLPMLGTDQTGQWSEECYLDTSAPQDIVLVGKGNLGNKKKRKRGAT